MQSKNVIIALAVILFGAFFFIGSMVSHRNNSQLSLYQSPNLSSNHQTLKLNSTITPFYRKGEWVKVALNKNGQIGWLSLDRLRALYLKRIHALNRGESLNQHADIVFNPSLFKLIRMS